MNSAVTLKRFYENREVIEKEIKIRTSDLIKTGRFFLCDKDDISQELLLEVFKALKTYDSTKSKISTYIKSVLKKKGIDLLRKRKAKWRQLISIDDILRNVELGKDRNPSEFFVAVDESNWTKFEIDFALSDLSADMYEIARLYLLESYNAVEISKLLKKSRTTINKKIKEIRKIIVR